MVHSSVGAYITLSGFGDEHAFRPQHAHALVEHDLDHARIRVRDQAACDPHRVFAGDDSGKIDEPALGLGHHLLGHDEDVARLELRVCAQQLSQVVARPHLRQALDADQLEGFHTARLRRARSEGSSRSSANGSE